MNREKLCQTANPPRPQCGSCRIVAHPSIARQWSIFGPFLPAR
jgi:hypothetical protein